jgi:hypothetical protein
MKERSVDIASILKAVNIQSWSKPNGPDLFKRVYEPIEYII